MTRRSVTMLGLVLVLAPAACDEGPVGSGGLPADAAPPPQETSAWPDSGGDARPGADAAVSATDLGPGVDVGPADASPGADGEPPTEAGTGGDAAPVDAGKAVDATPTGKQKDVWDQIIPAGFVTSADVGLPAGWTPKKTTKGDLSTTKDGEVLEDLQIEGMLTVSHDNVVVRRCRVRGGSQHAVKVTGAGALIEDSQLGLTIAEALLAKAVTGGGGDSITVDKPIPVGATVYLSASTPFQEQFIVVASSGSGPYVLKLEHRQSDADTRSPADPKVDHPKGDTIAWYHGPTHGPLPGNGVSGGATDYTVRRNLIQGVNDGVKQVDGLTVDNLIRLQFYLPPAHLDGIQTLRGDGGRVLHNTIIRSQDSTSVFLASPTQGEVVNFHWKWNLHVGAQYHSVRWFGTSAQFHWNRWFHVGFNPFLTSGEGLSTRDLRYTDGALITTKGFAGGPDAAGDGSGAADAWGNGYAKDPLWQDHFALQKNPEFK